MSERFHVGTRKGVFSFERAKAGWRTTHLGFRGVPVTMLLPDAATGLHAAVKHGHFGTKLHRSQDGGATWTERATPTYPEKPEGLEDVDPYRGRPIPWALDTVWALERGHLSQPGRLWCGTIPGGLFRSDDAGESWVLVRSLWDAPERKQWSGGGADFPGIHSILVHPEDGRRVSVGISIGGIWHSLDDGETWSAETNGMFATYMPPEQKFEPNAQDPHRVVRCPSQPNRWWTQHHNGVFRSDDDGRSWKEIPNVPPSVFGFAVAVHPTDGDTAWFVPSESDELRIPVDGRVVVARTRDAGDSFELLQRGLPNDHAYDLTFRHALDVDTSGRVLAFGTTTGALFISEDAGDHWTCLNAHLPPIYCVRFEK